MVGIVERLMEHRVELLAYLRKQGATAEQAEDLFQSALVRGLEPWASLPGGDALVPWFYRVLLNALVDQARRSSAAGRALDRYANEVSGEELPAEPRRVCMCTHTVLASMKPEYAQLIEAIDVTACPSKKPRDGRGSRPTTRTCGCIARGEPCARGSKPGAAGVRRAAVGAVIVTGNRRNRKCKKRGAAASLPWRGSQ
jgi:hypothetical protein